MTLAGTCAGTFAAHAATPNATDGALAAAAYADAQAAALAGLTLCQGLTRSGRLECAGAVLHGTEGYTVSALVTGTNDAFTLHVKLAGHSLAAVFHTHPTHGDIDRMFSDNDVAMADALRVPSYIATDDGMHVRLYATGARTHMQPHATRPSAYGVVVF